MITIFYYLTAAILIYFIAQGIWYALTLIYSFKDVLDAYREAHYGNLDEIINKGEYLPVSLIIPAFNEEKRILNSIYSVLNSHYKNTQIIVVSDGSTDKTIELLSKEFDLYEIPIILNQKIHTQPVRHSYKSGKYPNISVIDKEHCPSNNGADAINCGINASTTPLFITFDADTVLEPEAITRILLKFLSKPHCIMVGGAIYVLNDNQVEKGVLKTDNLSKNLVAAFQGLEYIRSFTYGRSGLNIFSGALCNPGAFTLIETNAVREINGFNPTNFAYDTEITMALHHLTRKYNYPTRVFFVSSAISWSEVPGTLKTFWKQRDKWQRGMLLSVLKFKEMLFNPRYGVTGLLVFPTYVLFDLLAPVIEFISYILLILLLILNVVPGEGVLWALLLAWGYIVVMTFASFYINSLTLARFNVNNLLRIVGLVTLEMLGFRQFRAACAFYGTCHYFYDRLTGKPI